MYLNYYYKSTLLLTFPIYFMYSLVLSFDFNVIIIINLIFCLFQIFLVVVLIMEGHQVW